MTGCAGIAGWVGSRRVLAVALPGCSSLPRVVADPMRRTRSTIGLIVGVTLITTFACVVLISCVISSVGLVSTMPLTVIQRRCEIGLLRALGFTAPHVRSMITKESVALFATAVLFGAALAGAGGYRDRWCRAGDPRVPASGATGDCAVPGRRVGCAVLKAWSHARQSPRRSTGE